MSKGKGNNPGRRAIIVSPVVYERGADYVRAVFTLADGITMGMRFESPEHIIQVFEGAMREAAVVWPDNEWVKMYNEG